jgi:hypothetical protein
MNARTERYRKRAEAFQRAAARNPEKADVFNKLAQTNLLAAELSDPLGQYGAKAWEQHQLQARKSQPQVHDSPENVLAQSRDEIFGFALTLFGVVWTGAWLIGTAVFQWWLEHHDPIVGKTIVDAHAQFTTLGFIFDPLAPWSWIIDGILLLPAIVAFVWCEVLRKGRQRLNRY